MKKLDRYILRQFIVSFIFCMLLFTVIAVAVDSSEHTDDFVKSGLSTGQIINQYYIGFVPYIWGLLYPLFVFIAVIYFTSKMAVRSEIIAILASGVTYNRWLLSYVAGGLFLASVLWVAARYWIPKGNEIRGVFQSAYIDRNSGMSGSNTGYHRRLDTNTYMGLRYFDTASRSGNNFFLNRVKNGKLIYNMRADRMQWVAPQKTWKFFNVVERTVDSATESLRELPEMEMKLPIEPEAFKTDVYLKDNLTTPELKAFIKEEELRGTEGINTFKVEQYRRTATPYSVLLLTVIGAIVAGKKTRGGSGLHLAIGIVIAVVFLVFDRFSTVFSTKGDLHPLVATWIPNAIFTVVAYYLYRKAPK
jgi:lipopolysaccharide export system permease protein